MIRLIAPLLISLASSSIPGNHEAGLTITGDISAPVHIMENGLAKLKTVHVKLRDHDGTVVDYTGPLVTDVLKEAGIVATEHPGKAVAIYVSAVASDGYEVVFGLGELTNAISGRTIILASRANGKPLDANVGPLRIVIEGDKVQARCIRMVTELKIGRLRR